MNLVDIVFGLLGIVMSIRLGQLITNARQRKSVLQLGKQILVVIITLILVAIYFFSKIFG